MSFRTIRYLRGMGKEKFDAFKDENVDGIKRLFKEMDADSFIAGYKAKERVERDQDIFHSILLSLALPKDHEGRLDIFLNQAAVDIEADLQEYWRLRRRPNEMNEEKRPAASVSTQPDPANNSVAATPREQGSPAIHVEPRDTAKSDFAPASPVALPPWISPYLKYMIELTRKMGPGMTKLRKKEVKHQIDSNWPIDDLGSASQHQLEMMSMFIRFPQAHQVRVEPRPRIGALNPGPEPKP